MAGYTSSSPKLRLQKALELANTHNIYAYDLDCANQYRSPLLSLDNEEIEITKKIGITVLEV